MIKEIPNLKPADFDTEKYTCIKEWKKTLDSFSKDSTVNRGYLTAAACICELCVKDVIEQTYKLLLFLKDEYEEGYFIGLLRRHNVSNLITELKDASEGEYCFPPIPDQINSKEMMNFLYEPTVIDIDKEELFNTVNRYIKCHNEFLEDYEQKRYQLKIRLED